MSLSPGGASKTKKPRLFFSGAEDALLRNVVETHGLGDWEKIAECLPSRSPRQCRDRWTNYLAPELINRPFTPEEDKVLYRKVHKYGQHWECLVNFFVGRSKNDLKNRWNTVIRKSQTLGEEISTINEFVMTGRLVEFRKRNHEVPYQCESDTNSKDPQEIYKISNLLNS
jgi:hypothetical protein